MRVLDPRWRVAVSVVVAVWILAGPGPAGAQAAREEPRIALLIGNSTYRDVPLRNPVNDVRAMARTLRELGFTVLAHENTTKRTMETAIIEFGRRLTEGGVGFFYYAGHGLQAAVDVELLLEQMAVPGRLSQQPLRAQAPRSLPWSRGGRCGPGHPRRVRHRARIGRDGRRRRPFLAEVKDGVLSGQEGITGSPGSVALNEKIQPDGKEGSAYSYRVEARFDDRRGGGERVETRTCTLSFVR